MTALVQPLAVGWRPSAVTALVSVAEGRTVTVVAVPLAGGQATPLVRVQDLSGSVPASLVWDVRSDGSAIAFSVATGATTHRLAVWEVSHPRAQWLTPDLRVEEFTPVWARDGGSVYFARWDPATGDQGVLSIGADGTARPAVRGPSTTFGSGTTASGVTPDGILLGADEFNGPTPWIHELATGRSRSLGIHDALVLAWRSAHPRALVGVTTSRLAPGAGYVALWDETNGTITRLLERPVAGADFDPTERRVVVASDAFSSSGRLRLALMDADGRNGRTLEGTEDARSPRWLQQGIAYMTFRDERMDLRLIPEGGGTPRVLYASDGRLSRLRIVDPSARPVDVCGRISDAFVGDLPSGGFITIDSVKYLVGTVDPTLHVRLPPLEQVVPGARACIRGDAEIVGTPALPNVLRLRYAAVTLGP